MEDASYGLQGILPRLRYELLTERGAVVFNLLILWSWET